MKKKLLKTFLLAAGLLVGGNAWAQEFDRTDGTNLTFYYTFHGNYVAGGSVSLDGGAYYSTGDGIYINTNARYAKFTLNTPLAVGDEIYFYFGGKTAGTILCDNDLKSNIWLTSTKKYGSETFTVTASEAGAKSFCIFGENSNTLRNVEVRRTSGNLSLAPIMSSTNTEVINFESLTGSETYTANTVVCKVTITASESHTATVYSGEVVTSGKNYVDGVACTKALSFPTGAGFFVRVPAGIGKLTVYYDTNVKNGSCNSRMQYDQLLATGRTQPSMYPGTYEVIYHNTQIARVIYIYVDNSHDRILRLYGMKWEPEFSFSKTISAAGWATYCCAYPLDFTNNITNLTDAYIITGGANGYVTMTSVKGGTVPANTGLLLKGTEGTVNIPAVANSETDVTANKLVGVTSEKTLDLDSDDDDIADSHVYVLMNETTGEKRGLGFYKTTTTSFTLSANTAYLPDGFDVAGARSFFALSDDVTGIDGVESANKEQNQVYNLNGQRVAQPSKGLYIINGKKVVMK